MGCAQGRCATRLRYAPTFYAFDSKPLSGAVQGSPRYRAKTVPKRDQGSRTVSKLESRNINRLQPLGEDAELATAGLGRATKHLGGNWALAIT